MSGVVIGTRTSSSDGRGGQYGVSYNAVPNGGALAERAWVDGLQQNEENRTNLALVNTGEVDATPSVFQLDIYDGATGSLVNTVIGLKVVARGWRQINAILRQYAPDTTQGYVRISKISGNNPFLAYAVINDGRAPGQRSGDGAYLPAMEEKIQDPGRADHHAALTAGLPERPFVSMTVGGTEGSHRTVGTLRLGLNPDAFPVIVRESETGADVLVARSSLGEGRVVAFSGQDFLSSGDRATLLGATSGDRLLANAVRWAGKQAHSASLRVLADNQRIADALEKHGLEAVEVVGSGPGCCQRAWSTRALADAHVAVVQSNEWGTAHLIEESAASLRAFVERGGGLVVAASALHWSWWIEERHGPLTADVLLRGTGISYNEDSIDEIESATTRFALEALTPGVIWRAWLAEGRLDVTQMALLPGLFSSALEIGRFEELDTALARLVSETPALPISSAEPKARLAAAVGETLGPYEWPEAHPWAAVFPGLPAEGADRVDGTVVVDATWGRFPADARRGERHFPLGFYAAPSTLVTIEIPDRHATGDLQVAVGELYDHTGGPGAALPIWRRAPGLRREFPAASRQTGVTNAYGGSIALVVPADYAGTIPITVRGAIPMAVYMAGESNVAEWFTALDGGAPQAIIQKLGGIRFVFSPERARGITDPGEVSAFWD
ncbi:MAG: hypothetical protein OXG44_07750, partial [Gammaproteobacteria bacterium]|nr:hypothetical protein [Gammaproteobacteria bacterium]